MTSTIDRPAETIQQSRTWQISVALAVFGEWLASFMWADLPELCSVSARAGGGASAQIMGIGRNGAAAVIAWRDRLPDSRVSLVHHGAGTNYEHWRATVHADMSTNMPIELWTHVNVNDEQAERLERDPQTAYAVLVDIAVTS